MDEGCKKRGTLSSEWVAKIDEFIDRGFGRLEIGTDVRCPSKCQINYSHDRKTVSIDLCKNGFMPNCDTLVNYGKEPPCQNVSKVQADEEVDYDRMEEMLKDV